MNIDLNGSTAVVTGGSSRLGASIAAHLAEHGANIALTYATNRDAASRVADDVSRFGGKVTMHRYDLSDAESSSALVTEVNDQHGRLDVVVANALRWPNTGPGPRPGPLDETDADWIAELHANTIGPVALVRNALRCLRKSEHGRVILIGTSTLRHPVPGAAVYLTAKSGLEGLAKGVAWDAGRDGVTANVVVPGWIVDLDAVPEEFRDEMARLAQEHATKSPMQRLVTAADVAAVVLFLASPFARSVTGETIHVTAGF